MRRISLISLLMTVFISYPNLAWLTCELDWIQDAEVTRFMLHFLGRFLYIWVVSYGLLRYNLLKLPTASLAKRILPNVLVPFVAFAVYKCLTLLLHLPYDRYLMIPTFQFFILAVMCITLGYTFFLYQTKQEKELELNQLQLESLQSRCNALVNQINPHFFFNSLNGISSLVRRKDEEETLDYINKLSDIFRYILQSEHKSLVPLEDELAFVDAYSQVLQVRYANKMRFELNVPDSYLDCQLPVLSVLPLLENVVVHNIIDSEHVMQVLIAVNAQGELTVSNPVFPKTFKADTHGTGLQNLKKRFALLMNREVVVESNDGIFTVRLPLRK